MNNPRPNLLDVLTGDRDFEALFSDAHEVELMLRFEKMLAQAEAEIGAIPAVSAEAIAAACDRLKVDLQMLASGFKRDGVIVPDLIRQLTAEVGIEHGGYLHFGATSQDVVDTALMLKLAEAATLLEKRMNDLLHGFERLSHVQGDALLMGHTRMQRARPIRYADKIASWSQPLARQLAALARARRQIFVIQLGGPVGNRAHFQGKGEDIARGLAQRLDLGYAQPWQSQRDPIIEFGSMMAQISGALGKFGADVTLMAQNEMGEVRVEGGGISSTMEHKSNPVNAELLVTLARYSAGLSGTLNQALVHENERSGAAWTLEWLTLPKLVINAGASLRIALHLIEQIHFQNKPV